MLLFLKSWYSTAVWGHFRLREIDWMKGKGKKRWPQTVWGSMLRKTCRFLLSVIFLPPQQWLVQYSIPFIPQISKCIFAVFLSTQQTALTTLTLRMTSSCPWMSEEPSVSGTEKLGRHVQTPGESVPCGWTIINNWDKTKVQLDKRELGRKKDLWSELRVPTEHCQFGILSKAPHSPGASYPGRSWLKESVKSQKRDPPFKTFLQKLNSWKK